MFRFLLEARENLALFTVLDRRIALLKLVFAPESRAELVEALEEIKKDIQLEYQDWPIKNAGQTLPLSPRKS